MREVITLPPNSTLTSHTPLLLARPRQKALRGHNAFCSINGENMETVHNAKFSLGRVLATPGAIDALANAEEQAVTYLQRHAVGDWGDLCQDDLEENNLSLEHGYRLLSAYRLSDLEKIWIITEADRSATTILLPEEY
jgi:hypothetical protein